MDFQTYLQDVADRLDKIQDQYLSEQVNKAKKVSLKTVHLVETFAQACKGGKRLRGALVKLGYELARTSKPSPQSSPFQGEEEQGSKNILGPALAYEIFQTAILNHDDIIDQSLTRRGKPTLYQTLGGDHYAISQAICLGDIGFFLAFQLVAQSDFPPEYKNKALVYFNETMLKTAAGQMLDIEIPHQHQGFEEQDVITISHYKTAHYTIIGPLQLGAILAGASDELLEKLEEFGKNLGIAFQIQDDILGVYGDEKILGKSVTSDVEEGKNTLLISYALKHTNKEDKEFLESHYGQGKIDDTQFMKFKEIFQTSGALDYSRSKALEYVDRAKKAIPKIAQNGKYAQLLNELADFLIDRNK